MLTPLCARLLLRPPWRSNCNGMSHAAVVFTIQTVLSEAGAEPRVEIVLA